MQGLTQEQARLFSAEAGNQSHRKWLINYMEQHLGEITAGGHDDWVQWYESYLSWLDSKGKSDPSSQKNPTTSVRKFIKVVLGPEHPSLKVIQIPTAAWNEINDRASSHLEERETKFLQDPDAIAAKAEALLDSPDLLDLAVGLSIVTGRRYTEIMHTGEFFPASAWSVLFRGQLKSNKTTEFEIPTLAPAEKVLAAYQKLRKLTADAAKRKGQAIPDFVASQNKPISANCDRLFIDLVPPREEHGDGDTLYNHLFRSVYAVIAAHWFCPPNLSDIDFRAAIQGHFIILDTPESDAQTRIKLTSQRNYYDYAISDGQGNRDGRLGIRLGEDAVEPIAYVRERRAAQDSAKERTQAKRAAEQEQALTRSWHRVLQKLNIPSDRSLEHATNDVLAALSLIPELQNQASSLARDLEQAQQLGQERLLEIQSLEDKLAQANANFASLTQDSDRLQHELQQAQQQISQLQLQNLQDARSPDTSDLERQVSTMGEKISGLVAWSDAYTPLLERLAIAFGGGSVAVPDNTGQPDADEPEPPATTSQAGVVPTPAPPSTPQPQSAPSQATPTTRKSPGYLDCEELVRGIFNFNDAHQDAPEQKWFISAKLLGDLLRVSDSIMRKVYRDLSRDIKLHHDAHGYLNHTQNRGRDYKELINWLKENGFDDLPFDPRVAGF